MTDATEALRREIGAAVTPDLQDAGLDHPHVDELVAYQLGRTSEERASDLQEHFSTCRECTELLIDLQTFVNLEEPSVDAPSSFETAAGWRSLRRRLRPSSGPRSWLLAATIAISAIGLSSWALLERGTANALRFEIAGLSLPQPDVPIVDLYPESAQRGTFSASTPIVVPPGVPYLTAVLALPDPPAASRFEVEVEDGTGRTVWQGSARISEHGTFRLGLPLRLFESGDLRIHLLAVDGESRERIETYPLSVLVSEAGSGND
jgi:hypothetical protein